MRILQLLGVSLVGLVLVGVAVGTVLPRQWHVERSIVIQARPEQVHALVEDFKAWQSWAAWDKTADPEVAHTYGGAERGVGAWWHWSGPRLGHGKMTITRSDVASGVWVDEMIETQTHVNAHGSLTWETTEGGALKVSWRDDGTLPQVVGGYFRGMVEKSLGDHFQHGLEHLKVEAEKLRAEQEAAALAQDAARAEDAAPPTPVSATTQP